MRMVTCAASRAGLARSGRDRPPHLRHREPPAGGLPSQPPPPDGHPIRTDARAWQRLWREGDIITEADGDDPGMPRRGRRKRMARGASLGIRGRVSTARQVAHRLYPHGDHPVLRRAATRRLRVLATLVPA